MITLDGMRWWWWDRMDGLDCTSNRPGSVPTYKQECGFINSCSCLPSAKSTQRATTLIPSPSYLTKTHPATDCYRAPL